MIKNNCNYFEKIDSEHKAYWLGFLMADGCIGKYPKTNQDGRLQINISSKDRCLLEKFKEDTGLNFKIIDYIPKSTYSNSEMSKIAVGSLKLCKDLNRYGIVSNKTGNEEIPCIRKDLKRHFIRGYFDGDGTSFLSRGYLTIGFTSGRNFLNQLREHLSELLNIDIKNIYSETNTKNAYRLYYNKSEEVNKIFHYMYDDASIYLDRKYYKLTQELMPQNEKTAYLNKLKKSNDNFVCNVIALRKKHKITKTQLANNIGSTISTISKLEKKSKIIVIDTAQKIADYFNVDIEQLMFGEIEHGLIIKKNDIRIDTSNKTKNEIKEMKINNNIEFLSKYIEVTDKIKDKIERHISKYNLDGRICAYYEDWDYFCLDLCDNLGYTKTEARELLHGGLGEFQILDPRKRLGIIRFVVHNPGENR